MGCVSSQTFEVEEEIVDPDDYNNDPVLILSGRRQSVAPSSVHLFKVKKVHVTSDDAEVHNRDMVMHMSDLPEVVPDSEVTSRSLTRRISFLVKQHAAEGCPPNKILSMYRRQSSVEVPSPPRSPNQIRRMSSLLRGQLSHTNEVCIRLNSLTKDICRLILLCFICCHL